MSALTSRPQWVDLKGEGSSVPDTVHHCVLRVDPGALIKGRERETEKVITDGIHWEDAAKGQKVQAWHELSE